MSQFYDLMIYVLSYAIVIIGGFLLINFLTNGFVLKWIVIKGSRGKKILIEEYDKISVKFRVGEFKDNLLRYKVEGGQHKLISNVPKESIERKYNIPFVAIDGEKNAVMNIPDNSLVTGHDPIKIDSYFERIIKMKVAGDDIFIKMVIGLVILCVVLVAISLYFNVATSNMVKELIPIGGNI